MRQRARPGAAARAVENQPGLGATRYVRVRRSGVTVALTNHAAREAMRSGRCAMLYRAREAKRASMAEVLLSAVDGVSMICFPLRWDVVHRYAVCCI